MFCHTYGRGRGSAQTIPGRPCSLVAALEPGRMSWTALPDAVRLGSCDEETFVAAGHWTEGDLPVLIVLNVGYDVTRLAFLLADLQVELLGRMRSDRVLYFPPPPQPPGKVGRKPKRRAEFKFEEDTTWPVAAHTTISATSRYGMSVATAWDCSRFGRGVRRERRSSSGGMSECGETRLVERCHVFNSPRLYWACAVPRLSQIVEGTESEPGRRPPRRRWFMEGRQCHTLVGIHS
ncbi:transposase [Streptomyces sp. BE147]|uniref:transposase n=1 Tax=Streptomyces sp. BE147 TaxID=3002524 RepID=UPI002E787471|nr:transposase [Streptomyces sp. BE147]MEE1737868.1 transposase [Streptomyces sp. BE147]